MNHGVVHHVAGEFILLLGVGQLALEQQVADFEVVALLRQLLDRVAAVQQLALVTVDIGDLGIARSRRHETGVVSELTGLSVQLANVDYIRANGTRVDRQLNAGGTIGER
jgi:murein endopeptidase